MSAAPSLASILSLRTHEVLSVSITLLVIGLASVLLRLYVRYFLVKRLGYDDYVLIAAYVSAFDHPNP
jgi:hypothetical protein